jgi:L-lactate dehydrogenase (cytochrome)|tara:strand:- start:3963 stop:5135 length:1173 start_codon:yes stop_codon:yes gene_type:complete
MTLDRCLNISNLRDLARRRLPKPIFDFLEGGAEDEWTARRNTDAFNDYTLMPRTLVDIDNIDMKTTLLGRKIDWPVIIAPTGASALFHHTGESAVARAAADYSTFYTVSTMSNTSLEEIGLLNDAPKIFQIYVFRDRSLIETLIERCRAAKYDALCITVDTPLSGNRERDRASGMSIPPKLTMKSMIHFASRPKFTLDMLYRSQLGLANFSDVINTESSSSQLALEFINRQFDRTVTWEDAAWLAEKWGGPIAIKGIMSVDDARRAVDCGATAIWLSNHGGRQIDGVPATIDRLADIREALDDSIEVILDSGVRRGTHVVKALAAGADACAIGRPYLYGLAADGYAGVAHALSILRSELERDLALLGCPTLEAIGRHTLASPAIGTHSNR